MPQEMSSGGMDGWIVVYGEQTRRAKREEEECRAPENSESILFMSYSGPCGVSLAEGEHVVPLSQTTVPGFALHVPAAGRCISPGAYMHVQYVQFRDPRALTGRTQPAGSRGFDPSVIDARAHRCLFPRTHTCTQRCANTPLSVIHSFFPPHA